MGKETSEGKDLTHFCEFRYAAPEEVNTVFLLRRWWIMGALRACVPYPSSTLSRGQFLVLRSASGRGGIRGKMKSMLY